LIQIPPLTLREAERLLKLGVHNSDVYPYFDVKMIRIAVMMLVHKNENQVNRLINHLSKGFDVYIHIDKRSSLKIYTQENIFVYKKYKTYWGSFNQIIATLYLLKKAHRKKYDRYILISGQELPIKTNTEIKIFFR
jgi:hypothetical protein